MKSYKFDFILSKFILQTNQEMYEYQEIVDRALFMERYSNWYWRFDSLSLSTI